MRTWSFQLCGIFFRDHEDIAEHADNIVFTVCALFLSAPGLILTVIGTFDGNPWMLGLGILALVYSLSRFVAGLIRWG